MARCIMVRWFQGRYRIIPEAEVENWEEVLDGIESAPELVERIDGQPPYTHIYRMPDGSIYFVALGDGR